MFSDKLDIFARAVGKMVSWLTLLMVIMMFAVVVLRYLFDTGWIAMQEMIVFMHAMIFMLGAAYALENNTHVRVDIFYGEMTQKNKAWVDLLGTVFLLMPMAAFILYSAWDYVLDAWAVKEGSREAGGLPGVFLLKTLLTIMPLALLLQGLSIVLSCWQKINSKAS